MYHGYNNEDKICNTKIMINLLKKLCREKIKTSSSLTYCLDCPMYELHGILELVSVPE